MGKKVLNLELGNLIFTNDISIQMKSSKSFSTDITTALNRYLNKDWGNVCDRCVKDNEIALINGERIFAKYQFDNFEIYIITEYDRSVTTVMFSYEY